MLRPVFGSGIIDNTVGIDEETTSKLYPNPNEGVFYLEGDVRDITIFTLRGERVRYDSLTRDLHTEVKISTRAPGIYIVRYRERNRVRSQKIVILP